MEFIAKITRLFTPPFESLLGLGKKVWIHALLAILAVYVSVGLGLVLLTQRTKSYTVVSVCVAVVFLAALVLAVRLGGQKRPLAALGITKQPLPYAMLGLMFVVAILYAASKGDSFYVWRLAFHLVAVAGVEELVFRGYVYPRLFAAWGLWPALLVSGVLFSLGHNLQGILLNGNSWFWMLNSPGGYILGHAGFLLLYLYTGSILNPIILHASLNLTGEVTPVTILGLLYTVAVVLLEMRKRKRAAQ